MFEKPINMNEVFSNGYSVNKLLPFISRRMLNIVKNENFIFEENPKINNGYKEKYFKNRYTAEWDINGKEIPRAYRQLASEVLMQFNPVLRELLGGKDCTDSYVGVHLIKEGYEMDWHQDISSPAFIQVLCYVSEDLINEEDQGRLCIRKARWDDINQDKEFDLIDEVVPSNGTVVILDNMNPLYEHKASKFMPIDNSKERYLLSFALNAKNNW